MRLLPARHNISSISRNTMKQISWCGRKMFSGEKVTIVSTVKSCTVNYFLGKTVLISPWREGYDTGLRVENGKIAFVVSIRWKQRTDLLFSLKSFLCFCFTKTRRRASTPIILFVVIPQKGEQKCSLTKIDNAMRGSYVHTKEIFYRQTRRILQ